jgi:diguanylate cyclase (GGDEF)-like protein/putative nucleotidyltransferase with HDIG domain
MHQRNWKSSALLVLISVLSVSILISALLQTVWLPLLGWQGLAPMLVLLLLTLGASRFTVAVESEDHSSQSRKSVADALVFLAVMLYAIPPANTAAPATLLAAVVAIVASYRHVRRRALVFTTGIAIISTFIAAHSYGLLASVFYPSNTFPTDRGVPLNVLLVPICTLAVLQYLLCTMATTAFLSVDSGKTRIFPSPESLVWTSITQVAGASSAVLFYSGLNNEEWSFIFLGLVITGLIHLLYRFNENRLHEVRFSEKGKHRHLEQMANIHMNTIESLAIAIDAKDQTTHGHVRRTQIYATEMGRLFDVTPPEVQALFAGALLHDIGKLAVPEYILNKPGKLTQAEFAKMKIHPTVGGDILKRVNFPYPVEDIVRYHHERWDGGGYPKGLRAEAIPLVTRIISVVDFYDATRCDRPYRRGMRREDSVALLQNLAGTAFDPRVVEVFVANVEAFDKLIAAEDIKEQVASELVDYQTATRPDAGLASDVLGTPDNNSGFRSITEAQREVFALHEIAQTIGSSLNLNDTVSLITNKLRSIIPFDTCVIFTVDDKSGKAVAIHVAGEDMELFLRRKISVGDGISGWVIANARSMCNASPELDLVGLPDDVVRQFRGVLVSPLLREDGAFGSITLYSKSRTSYSTEHVRLLESVAQHASSALNNALTFEKTKQSALTDPLTELPNARGFYMMLEQRLAECQRMNRESLALICMDVDNFKQINDTYGHTTGDRMLASIAGVMRQEARQMDILTRYAGDEFVIIMPMASTDMAQSVAERLRGAVESKKFAVRTGRTASVGLSVGIACFPADGESTEALLTAAARNMQNDKHSRKTMATISATPAAVAIDALR